MKLIIGCLTKDTSETTYFSLKYSNNLIGSVQNKSKLTELRINCCWTNKKIICAGITIQPLRPFVVCCCTLNKTRYCDQYLFDKLAQTQIVINWQDTPAPSVHQWRFRLSRFRRVIFGDVMSYNSLTTINGIQNSLGWILAEFWACLVQV